MRICHVITRMILGGAQENTLLTCEGLHARGHDVTLITGPALGPEGELLQRAKAGGYEVIVLDEMRRAIHPVRDCLAYRRLRQLLRDLGPEVMHSHSSKAGILARKAAASVGKMAVVHTIHGLAFHPYQSSFKNLFYILLERRAARRTNAIISVANAMTSQAIACNIGRPDQYTTIYSGMDVTPYLNIPHGVDHFRASLNLPPHAVLVTQVSRLAKLKGHEYLIRAAAQTDNRIIFCFVGDGALRDHLKVTMDRAGLRHRFRFTGLVPPEQIPTIMHASDIVVHCSFREGLARALPQAMLAGKPVVAFDVDGAREVVNSNTGVLLEPGDSAGLKIALETLAKSPEMRTRLGDAGREFCRNRFDHHRMIDQIEAVYKRVVERGHKS